jgi:lysophospholipase L1-like esterase
MLGIGKVFAATSTGLVVGLILGIVLMLLFPWSYWRVADVVSWRVNFPSIAQTHFERTMTELQLRGDSLVLNSDVLLFGDSHLQAVPLTSLAASVNFAIAGETTERLAKRISRYPSLQRVHSILLMSGRNDLMSSTPTQNIESSMANVFKQIPHKTKIILVSIPPGLDIEPVIESRIKTNKYFQSICNARPKCFFVSLELLADDQGKLLPHYDSGDGIHLNQHGYIVFLNSLKSLKLILDQ